MTRAEEAIEWIEENCVIPEGMFAGQPVRLMDWQKDELRRIYDNPAVTRKAILSFAKKNAKTTLAAFILLLHILGPEARLNSQICSTATSRDQAGLLCDAAAKSALMSPTLAPFITYRASKKQIFCEQTGVLYSALSADSGKAHGRSSVLAIHDECGQETGPTSKLITAVGNAMGAHIDPLEIFISTQAPTDGAFLSILIDDFLAGHNPKNTVSLYSAPLEMDAFSDEAIRAANPAAGQFLNMDELRQLADKARRIPTEEAEYRNYTLNQRVSTTSPFITKALWDACGEAPADLTREKVWVALDLSESQDLTARVMVGETGGKWSAYPRFWLPENGLKEKSERERVPYDVWHRQSFLDATPGKTIDYTYIAQDMAELCQSYAVQRIYYDPWRFPNLMPFLRLEGFTEEEIGGEGLFRPFKQQATSISPAMREVEALFLEEKIRHGGHPVLSMCAANAVVGRDPQGNRHLNKAKSVGRIDGMVAMVMAIGGARLENPETPAPKGSYLDDPDAELLVI